jgi:hypothetical protein
MPREIGDYLKTVPHAMPKQRSKLSCNGVIVLRQPDDDETNLILTGTARVSSGREQPKMNYTYLILDAEGASGSKDCFSQLLNNPPQIFSIGDIKAEQIERISICRWRQCKATTQYGLGCGQCRKRR